MIERTRTQTQCRWLRASVEWSSDLITWARAMDRRWTLRLIGERDQHRVEYALLLSIGRELYDHYLDAGWCFTFTVANRWSTARAFNGHWALLKIENTMPSGFCEYTLLRQLPPINRKILPWKLLPLPPARFFMASPI